MQCNIFPVSQGLHMYCSYTDVLYALKFIVSWDLQGITTQLPPVFCFRRIHVTNCVCLLLSVIKGFIILTLVYFTQGFEKQQAEIIVTALVTLTTGNMDTVYRDMVTTSHQVRMN